MTPCRPQTTVRGVLLTLLLFALPVGPASASALTPKAGAEAFYHAYLALHPSGVPDAEARAKLHPFITPRLDELLRRAAEAEARRAKASGGAEPPVLAGDIFTSLFEGATSFHVVACDVALPYAGCVITFRFHDTLSGVDTTWTDEVRLARVRRLWKLDDVLYKPEWDLAGRNSLQGGLHRVISAAEAASSQGR